MGEKRLPYVHLLLFRCERCNEPLVIFMRSEAANLEEIDGNSYVVECHCGWSKSMLGVEAIRHWVTPWEDRQSVFGPVPGVFNERQPDTS
jgi:hypothetical protein